MEKMRMESKSLIDEKINAMSELFPGCIDITSDVSGNIIKKVNFEKLKMYLENDNFEFSNEFYELNWTGKKEAIKEANKITRKTLRPRMEDSINWDNTKNLYIEGDNLEVLKLLQESYLNNIDVIYIDPPYNTGKDFIYNDSFKMDESDYENEMGAIDDEGNRMFRLSETSGRFHSIWCSMIFSRMLLARNLLTTNGVCFISIDDNEVHNLRKICDEVFGYNNFLGSIIQNKGNAQNDAINIQKNHEYILVYTKNRKYQDGKEIPIIASFEDSTKEVFIDENGKYYYKGSGIVTGGEGGILNKRKNLGYTIYYNPQTKDKMAVMDYDIEKAQTSNDAEELYTDRKDLIEAGYVTIRAPKKGNRLGCWTWSCDKFNCDKEKILITDKLAVIQKVFVDKEDIEERNGRLYFKKSGRSKNTRSILDYSTSAGTSSLTKLFGTKVFDNPKNIEMLKYLIGLVDKEDVTVLDFFSGTASTAEAVIRLNEEDGQDRTFIMVQLQEEIDKDDEIYKMGFETICSIGKERIKRVYESLLSDTKQKHAGMRVFCLADSNMKDVYYAPNDITQNLLAMLESNIKEDRTDLDLLFGCLLDWGLPLSLPYSSETIDGCTVHNYNGGDLIACFDENVPTTVIKEIAKKQPDRVVFRDSSFEGSPSKINVGEIFKLNAPDTVVKVI